MPHILQKTPRTQYALLRIDLQTYLFDFAYTLGKLFFYNLKSPNLLVEKNWRVKVGDFNLSRWSATSAVASQLGNVSPRWMAPEVLRSERYTEKADIYSYGIILWELATRRCPYEGMQITSRTQFHD